MQISSRFTIGVHTLLCIAYFKDEKVTSNFIAGSVNANPVVIRRMLGQLKAAGLVTVEAGVGGASLDGKLASAQAAFREDLRKTTLADLLGEIGRERTPPFGLLRSFLASCRFAPFQLVFLISLCSSSEGLLIAAPEDSAAN